MRPAQIVSEAFDSRQGPTQNAERALDALREQGWRLVSTPVLETHYYGEHSVTEISCCVDDVVFQSRAKVHRQDLVFAQKPAELVEFKITDARESFLRSLGQALGVPGL